MAELKKTKDVLLKTDNGLLRTENWTQSIENWRQYNKYKIVLTCVYDAHKNKHNNKRVIGIAQLC